MASFQKKWKWKNMIESWPILITLSIFVLFFAWQVFGFMGKLQVTMENRKSMESKFAELQKEKEKLSSDIDKLKTDEGKEAEIREKFGLVKEGENLIIIVEDKNNPKIPLQANSTDFLSFFKNWFK